MGSGRRCNRGDERLWREDEKIAIVGLSATAMVALAASSLSSDINLTIVGTPCDFVFEKTIEENFEDTKERLAGVSSLSYKGKALPYVPYFYRHPEYWNRVISDGKKEEIA